MHESTTDRLWYKAPAEAWVESLPIGNGRLGAMVPCGVNRDHLSLNEESVWAGRPGQVQHTRRYVK